MRASALMDGPRYVILMLVASATLEAGVEYPGEFAPSAPLVAEAELPYRDAVSLNGCWQFQPQEVPPGFVPDQGRPPELALPVDGAWEKTPIKIPSPWNVNTWGAGRHNGEGTDRPYWPDSVYFPSYPEAWDGVRMGWLRRGFTVPPSWAGRRVVLHFDAVAGDCVVLVNGRTAGRHFDKYLPFDLDITDLVSAGGGNELRVGVRSHELFNKRSAIHPKMTAPYPCGSETARLVGIWQDVSLFSLPPVRVADVFVKPRVKEDRLGIEVTVRNDGPGSRTVRVGGKVAPWINRAGKDIATAPVPAGAYGDTLLELPARDLTVAAGTTAVIELEAPAHSRLKTWAPGAPNLNGAHVSLADADGTILDVSTTRFGWREFEILGKDLFLNGKKIQLSGDLLHPFGPLILSRRHVWAWYKLVQDFGGNAVRPHAQIHPRHYLDLADEMGIVVLDETALFGSSVALNFEEPVAWERFENHYDGMVLRDRNHPSVVGWSFGNELFAVFDLNHVAADQADLWYGKLADLGRRALKLDPTRQWISCDGDGDLRGRLPVWSRHFGHGPQVQSLPDVDKPLMVGESGGTYYARPSQLKEFNGQRAYQNYQGRSEALAIDVHDNIVHMARPHLAYFSASETAWFGVEHLNFGYHDFSRPPNRQDGIVLTRPYQEGKSGMQIERIPPYVDTLNPGWDPGLPLYRALPMFDAVKAALARPEPAGSPWSQRHVEERAKLRPVVATITAVGFVGNRAAPLARRLADLGLPLADGAHPFTIIDAAAVADAAPALEQVKASGGTTMLMLGEGGTSMLPPGMELTDRPATALVPDPDHPWTSALDLSDLYFAEDGEERFIQRHGIGGVLPEEAKVLLRASDTDWSLFNDAPEVAKCAAVVLYEKRVKPAGAAIIEVPWGKGRLLISTLDYRIASRTADNLWRSLFSHAGIRLGEGAGHGIPALDGEGVLLHALGAGRFGAPDLANALSTDFIGENTLEPVTGMRSGDFPWRSVDCPNGDRFLLGQLHQTGPEAGAFATYFSFWIRSPRALDDVLTGGPDVPRFTLRCYVSASCRLFLNGKSMDPGRSEAADYRKLLTFDSIPLKKGWNRFLIKVVSDSTEGANPGTLAVRASSNRPEFLHQIDTTIERRTKD